MFSWLTNQTPNPILLDLKFVSIHWYGLLVALAIIIGLIIAYYLYQKYNLKRDLFWDLSFYLIIFSFLGDRLAHVFFYEWEYYSHHLLDIFKVWQGGLAIHGAILTGVLVLYLFARKNKISFWQLGDIFVTSIAIGLTIGRWGNYFNQEIYGQPTNSWLAIPIDLTHRVKGYENFSHFTPSFLYESLICLIIFGVLILLHYLKIKKELKIPEGYILFTFLILYSLSRFGLEFLRIDTQPIFLNLRTGQWLSLVTLVLVVILLFLRQQKKD